MSSETFWVYESRQGDIEAKIHRGSCGFCNEGKGTKRPKKGATGRWMGPFPDYLGAYTRARDTGKIVRLCFYCTPELKIQYDKKPLLTRAQARIKRRRLNLFIMIVPFLFAYFLFSYLFVVLLWSMQRCMLFFILALSLGYLLYALFFPDILYWVDKLYEKRIQKES